MACPRFADRIRFPTQFPLRIPAAVAALTLAASIGTAAPADASIALSARTKPISVAVIGDSVANDLGRGLEGLYGNKPQVRIIKHTRFATGLVRTDYFNWNASLRRFLIAENPDIILVMIGGNDRQPIRVGDRRFDPLTAPWLTEYERRVTHFMNTLKRERTQVYWVGLPAVRSPGQSSAYQAMNGIYRRQAVRHGFKYLSIWNEFLTAGAYSSFGQSLEGVKRKLRKDDGMHFTDAGKLLLAAHIARAIGLR